MSYENVQTFLLLLLALLVGAFLGCMFRRWFGAKPETVTAPKSASAPANVAGAASPTAASTTTGSDAAKADTTSSSAIDSKNTSPSSGDTPKSAAPEPTSSTGVSAEAAENSPATGTSGQASAPVQARGLSGPVGGVADDLKKIKGVGPKLESTLHGLGIYHFAQVANWTATDVAEVDDLLSFKGRIERDNWIAQAKDFVKNADD